MRNGGTTLMVAFHQCAIADKTRDQDGRSGMCLAPSFKCEYLRILYLFY